MRLNLSKIINSRSFTIRVLRGAVFLSVGVGIYQLCNFAFRYILIRTWTPSDYGIFILITTIAGLLGIFTEFNLNATTTIFLSKDIKSPANKQTIIEILSTFLLLTSLVLAVTFVIPRFISEVETWRVFRTYFWLIWILVIFTGLLSIISGILRAYKKMNYEATANAVKGVSILGLSMLAIYVLSRDSVSSIIIILIAAQVLTFLAAIALLSQTSKVSIKSIAPSILINTLREIRIFNIRSILIFSSYMSVLSISNALILSVDKIMIPYFLSTAMLGVYGGANLLAHIPKFFTATVASSLQAFMPERCANIAEAKKQYFRFLCFFVVVTLIGYGIFVYITPYLISLLLTEEYGSVTSVVSILIIGQFFADISSLNATFATSTMKTKNIRQMATVSSGAVVVNLAANWVLIPKYGLEGAAISNAISFALVAFISLMLIMRIK